MDDNAPALRHPGRPLWATIVSVLFHPLLIPTYLYLVLMLVNPYLFGSLDLSNRRATQTLIMLLLYTAVIPLIAVLLMVALEMVQSVRLEDRMERIGPLLLVMIMYFWVYYNFSQSNDIPEVFSTFMLGIVIALGVAFAINTVDRISLHAVGMGGMVTALFVTMWLFGELSVTLGGRAYGVGVLVLLGVVLAGLVGTARLILGAHDRGQVYSGYAVGVLAQLVAVVVKLT